MTSLNTAINQLGTRYVVRYSGPPLHLWRVYDLYHSDIRNQYDVDMDIPDTSEAMVLLTEDACVELVRARMHEGLLEVPSIVGYQDATTDDTNDKRVLQLEEELLNVKCDLEVAQKALDAAKQESAIHMSRNKLLDTFVALAEKDQLRDDVVEALARLA